MIYLCLLVPIIAILILAIFYNKKVTNFEYLILFVIPLIAIIISKYVSIETQTKCKEYLNFKVVSAEYYEPWSTWDVEECSKKVPDGKDKNGKTKYKTKYYDCSHCDNHSSQSTATLDDGSTISIDKTRFDLICNEFKNVNKVELNRKINYSHNCGVDGEKFTTVWNNDVNTIVPIVKENYYVNKVKASRSIFKKNLIDYNNLKTYQLFEYPNYSEWNYNPILGINNIEATKKLAKWNAYIGKLKQVHMMILVFYDKPLDAGLYQDAYWGGGNKNEFILCVGVSNNIVTWGKVISWTEEEALKLNVERNFVGQNFDIINIVDYMTVKVKNEFVRKKFIDFEYIRIDPTPKAMIIAFIIVTFLTAIIATISINNNIDRSCNE